MWVIHRLISLSAWQKVHRFGISTWLFLVGYLIVSPAIAQTKQWHFDRINLELVDPDPLATASSTPAIIDSTFKITVEILSEFERTLGYKLTEQLHLRLFLSRAEYQSNLQQHPVWLERYQSDYSNRTSNYYPVLLTEEIAEINIQLRYLVAHFTLNEFLNGSSIRQKMTQSGYQQFPSWMFQGLCAFWAGGWNIQANDEFNYHYHKGAFTSPNSIDPLGAQVYGRRIWYVWQELYGQTAYSNFWFILKYTGNPSAAVEFLTGMKFNDWYRSENLHLVDRRPETTSSDISIQSSNGNAPLLSIHPLGRQGHYLFQLYIPDEERWVIESPSPRHRKENLFNYRTTHAKLIADAAFYMVTVSPNAYPEAPVSLRQTSVLQETIWQIDTHGIITSKTNGPSPINSAPQFLRKSQIFVAAKSEKVDSSLTFSLIKCPLSDRQSTLELSRTNNGSRTTVWADTINSNEFVRGLIIESNNQISFIQSSNYQWFIHFTKIEDTTIFRWKIPVDGHFVNQYLTKNKIGESEILEHRYSHNKALIRKMDIGTASANEIQAMKWKQEQQDSSKMVTSPLQPLLLEEKLERADTWTYLSPFPVNIKSPNDNRSNAIAFQSASVKIASNKATSTLEQGGLCLSNEEPLAFPAPSIVNPNSWYNHPLTPEIRFYLKNPRWGNTVKLGLLSNLPMNRIAIRLEQTWNLGTWTIQQRYFHRSRDYYERESVLFQNVGDQIQMSLGKNYGKAIALTISGQYQRDILFQKINRPFSVLKQDNTLASKSLFFKANYNREGHNPRRANRYQATVSGVLGISHYAIKGFKGSGYQLQWSGGIVKPIASWIELETHGHLNLSGGNVRTQFWVGGSQGWIEPKPWLVNQKTEIEKYNLYAYRQVGGYVRGFLTGERIGHSSAVLNMSVSVSPYAKFHQNLIKSNILQSLKIYGFFDLGSAYIGSSPKAPENPFNLATFSTPNYRLNVFADRNPWIAGSGFGVSSYVLRMPIRYEVGWGLKEGKFLSPIQHVCMSWNF
jgi:hypothetical protein